MNTTSLEPPDDTAIAMLPLAKRHLEPFNQARAHLQKIYGKSPTSEELMRFWLVAPSWEIVFAFETAVVEVGEALQNSTSGENSEALPITL